MPPPEDQSCIKALLKKLCLLRIRHGRIPGCPHLECTVLQGRALTVPRGSVALAPVVGTGWAVSSSFLGSSALAGSACILMVPSQMRSPECSTCKYAVTPQA